MTEPDDKIQTGAEPARQPQRPFFARLAAAVRRQDWFVVALEVAIVVLGVVIGFQVTAWGQARSDRAREQVYLRQLASDLRETEQRIHDVDEGLRASERATTQLARAFNERTPPLRDSLVEWINLFSAVASVHPVVGTAEALVATGDLGLVRDDSLRSAITAYLQTAREEVTVQHQITARWFDNRDVITATTDPSEIFSSFLARVPLSLADSLRGTPDFPLPRDARPPRFPLDAQAFLADSAVSQAAFSAWVNKRNLKRIRDGLREASAGLLRQVEAQIE